jgi:hypothetical protein
LSLRNRAATARTAVLSFTLWLRKTSDWKASVTGAWKVFTEADCALPQTSVWICLRARDAGEAKKNAHSNAHVILLAECSTAPRDFCAAAIGP